MAENTDGVKSQIIMRVDEPTEENKDNEKKEEILSIKPSQICSPTTMGKHVLAPSQFSASNPFSNNTLENKFGQKPLLKPSKLGANSGTQFGKTSFTLNPSRLNPLAKTPIEEDNSDRESDKNKNSNSVANGETLKFVPLLHSESKSSEIIVKPVTSVLPTTQASQSNFVFGQNLQERVIAESNSDDSKPSTSCLNSNGTSDMLFSSALKDTKIDNVDVSNREGKSLTESAREYEESRAIKRKYEEVEVKTGERVKSQIIMRVDEPTEGKVKDENKDNEKKEEILSIKPSQICSPTTMGKHVLAPSQFSASNPFSNNTLENKFGQKPLLKPSKLGANSGTQFGKTSFTLNPSRLNPLAKTPIEEDNSDRESDKNKNSNSVANGETLKFVPLLHSESKSSEIIVKPVTSVLPTTQASQSNFVFGQNLQERVIAESNSDDSKPSTSCLNSNGTSDMLFSSALKDTKIDNVDVSNREGKSLTESAREYEESRAIKRKYEEVEVKTGEEEEINILHISCKLFAYDKASGSWQERGRGNLRLNDQEVSDNGCTYTQSRLVFRTFGSLRVILNTKIWAEMSIQLASPKSVRLTAIESSGEIKVFLVMGTTEDINKLHKHLDERLKNEINRQKHKKVSLFKRDVSAEKLTADNKQ
ncbi:RanBP1 domain [Popillia japonica]|uniref:RanBP1 domain n=1 Tax=Popillia japonica TaxID=7064 RepID=A0AAW1IDT0_POPJA